LQDLGFPPSDDEMNYDDMTLEGINIDDLDASTDDEDLLEETMAKIRSFVVMPITNDLLPPPQGISSLTTQ
jgi:hypothetical protein